MYNEDVKINPSKMHVHITCLQVTILSSNYDIHSPTPYYLTLLLQSDLDKLLTE